MGAWDTGPLENDSARDFLSAVADGGGLTAIEDAFDHVLEAGEEYLEAPTAEEAVAAAVIIARFKDGVKLVREAELEAWIAQEKPTASAAMVSKARDALHRVMTEPSELIELWAEGDGFDDFKAGINDLIKRLG
jgi:putative IMPACT (imprinted ancient) family translation regulator